tara:strand:+ start:196 stop:330 length:135 start_codon:yes stop_codon:yes gene_type:complete
MNYEELLSRGEKAYLRGNEELSKELFLRAKDIQKQSKEINKRIE